tara:strand:+ start:14 stop:937 length:924 start_codon:yes stop_codon:yes gene_type:complete
MQKINKLKNIVNIIFFSLIVYFFYNLIDFDLLKETVFEFKISYLFVIFSIFLLRPLMKTYRWFIIVRHYSEIKFIDFFRNIVLGLSFDIFTSSPIALEITKVIKIKKEIGLKKSVTLIFFDRIYTLIFRIISLEIMVVLYSFFYIEQIFSEVLIIFLITVLFVFFLNSNLEKFLSLKFFKKFIKADVSKILKIYKTTKVNFIELFFINFIILLANILLYYLIFKSLNNDTNFFDLSIFISIIDFLTQFQFIIFGFKEFTTVYFSNFININNEIAFAGAIIHKVLDSFNIIFLYGIFNLFKFKTKNKN